MAQDNVIDFKKPDSFIADRITDILRQGARRLLATALETEINIFLNEYKEITDAKGYQRVVRNGYLPEREVQTGIGQVPVGMPRIRDRQSEQSWIEILVDQQRRGLQTAPELAIGDGALGFWKALSKAYDTTRWQRCWFHKTANILNKLPKSIQSKAKDKLHQIWMADSNDEADKNFDAFIETYSAKYPKATDCLKKDREAITLR